ncbi:hypothetical protein RN001_002375 [Aquatica leii]|uniref:DUF4806 domain-containing protein n=1 Tax=Aquatica leii TaxID=1421715 RepID=A0AAN7PGW3_9COLE|nr:hypothetical protein RN001_002375 [Aquatica leii]
MSLVSAIIKRGISTSNACYGKRNFKKFSLYNKRGTKIFKQQQSKNPDSEIPIDKRGVRDIGYTMNETFITIPEMIPNIIVPDLTNFKLKPYVSYRAPDVVQSEFIPKDLFNVVYAQKIMDDFKQALELHKPSISTNSNFNYSLPCQNLQDLENLEKYITKKDQYTLFCEYIRNIGGNGGKDFVVRFMKTLLTNATGELCSWTGAKNNFKLINLKIMKAAYETINSGNMQVTLKEFEMFIKEWLRHCKQRRMIEDLK